MIFKLPCGFDNSGTTSRRTNRAYVEELEQRVKFMDDQLQRLSRGEKFPRQSVQDFQSPGTGPLRDTEINNSEPGEDETNLVYAQPPDDEASQAGQDTSDQPSYVLRARDGKMRFFGASSGFGVPCSQEVNRSEAKHPRLGWVHAARRSAIQWPLTNWVPRILQNAYEQRITQALPSKEATLSLVAFFLDNFNRTIPLVDDTSLMRLVERHFSWNPDESPSSWVLLNVVLALSYRERAQASSDASTDLQKSLGHIKNALNVLVDLFLRNADLLAVQGLLGLALYFQGTPNAQALFMLAASAMRLSHSIGLHRNTTSGFTKAEIEERRRVFWISFILDADISLRVGRPPVQDMEDYNTPLPSESPHDGKGIISINGTRMNFFRAWAQFATVQRLVYRHLQTVAVTQQPKEIAFKSAKACEDALLLWRSSIPDLFRPKNIFASEPFHSRQHLFRLNLAYHCCYANLRQLSLVTSSANASGDSQSEVDKEIVALRLRCIDSARSALALLPYVRLLGLNYKWNVLYFFATASVALTSEIRLNSTHHNSNHDLSMAHEVTSFLKDVSSGEPGTFVDFILSVCSDLESSARRAIHQTRSDGLRSATGVHRNVSSPDTGLSEQQLPTDHGDNTILHNEVDLLTDIDPDAVNTQWSIPPFWNWQDIFIGLPVSPETNRG
ncbi:uncharacterized protein N7477_001349 [Penicillium maclennaniae]|uniref:uncharacterized protein n=1 Tax=Penicillium maclennaniae TaxID=1343394 RepID=UPI0025423F50|nr:uncharacterized protein N7477_001349 [Penicillium maclennaniae]KAJ5681409.1 hypothetical protein N7477_001349 [Penicillium maclennaniae]